MTVHDLTLTARKHGYLASRGRGVGDDVQGLAAGFELLHANHMCYLCSNKDVYMQRT